MLVRSSDRALVKWAVDNGYRCEYLREYGLPDPVLRIQLGTSSAYFNDGRLVRWRAEVDARYLDQLMCELTHLFLCCAQHHAYPEQIAFLGAAELRALHRAKPA